MKRLGLTSNDIGPRGLEALAASKRMPELIHVELDGNRIESPFETFGIDEMTGLVNRQGINLPDAGKQLEAKYGPLAWLHGPSQLARFPPDDSDL
ncbi:MAG: leucine-rich repeat domain-containing protein [Kofleriaceae bacterium]